MLQRTLAAAVVGCCWGCAVTFPCSTSDQCTRDGAQGTCQASGYCSFPDDGCESDERYGELAPEHLAGTCVPLQGTGSDSGGLPTTGGGPTSAAESSAEATTTPALPNTSSSTSSGAVDDTSSTGRGEESSSSSGDVPVCCNGDCPNACGGNCQASALDGPIVDAEVAGVAVIGDSVVWSTGIAATLQIVNIETGVASQLAPVPQNTFVSKLAADDTHVYFVDFGGPTVRRVSASTGVVELVTQVSGATANFGNIAVDDQHVYFAMLGTGGLWRGAKDLSDNLQAEMVVNDTQPFDVVLDDTHVYWIDLGSDEIRRLEIATIGGGQGVPPTTLRNSFTLRALAIDETHLFFAEGGDVLRANKDGTGVIPLANGPGIIWDMEVDEQHLYWTSDGGDSVERVAKDGTSADVLWFSANPQALDLDCSRLFWAETGTDTVQMLDK